MRISPSADGWPRPQDRSVDGPTDGRKADQEPGPGGFESTPPGRTIKPSPPARALRLAAQWHTAHCSFPPPLPIRSSLRRFFGPRIHPGSDVLSRARIWIRIPPDDIGSPDFENTGTQPRLDKGASVFPSGLTSLCILFDGREPCIHGDCITIFKKTSPKAYL